MMGENYNNFDIKLYEREGSPIGELYQFWFNDLANRVFKIMSSDGINYKIKRRRKYNIHKSLYAVRYYDKIRSEEE